MLPTQALLTRPALRLFHSAIPRCQQQVTVKPQNDPVTPAPDTTGFGEYIQEVDNSTSTHKGAQPARTLAPEPREVFAAWNPNSFYAPLAFLRSRRIRAYKRPKAPEVGPGAAEAMHDDVFRQLDIEPRYESNNQLLLSAFITTMGRIKPRAQTRLSWRSQRMVTQAIKRSRQMGIMPITGRPRYFVPRPPTADDEKEKP